MRRLRVRILGTCLLAMVLTWAPLAAQQTAPVEQTVTLKVRGMFCGSCTTAVSRALQTLDGVTVLSVDRNGGQVTVRYNRRKVTPVRLVETLRRAGYDASWPEE